MGQQLQAAGNLLRDRGVLSDGEWLVRSIPLDKRSQRHHQSGDRR